MLKKMDAIVVEAGFSGVIYTERLASAGKRVLVVERRYVGGHCYQHTVLGPIEGQKVPIPFDINSMDEVFLPEISQKLTQKLVKAFGWGSKVPPLRLREENDTELSFLADCIHEHIFLRHIMKQLNKKLEKILFLNDGEKNCLTGKKTCNIRFRI